MSYPYIGGPFRPDAHQFVAYTASAGTITNAVGAGTNMVRVVLTTAGHIAIGASPTATTNDVYLPANVVEYFIITPGHKVSAIRSASDGVLHVTELSR